METIKPHSYSQNNEQEIILKYFGDYKGQFLDIGANDGVTLSNTRALAKKGWKGVLLEPSKSAYGKLNALYENNTNILVLEAAIGNFIGESEFFESGPHLGENDIALLSTLKPDELNRWQNQTQFRKTRVNVWTFNVLQKFVSSLGRLPHYQFINIDAEGCDLEILKQIDLNAVVCSCVCVEHNSNKEVENEIRRYCASFGLFTELLCNAENIILAI